MIPYHLPVGGGSKEKESKNDAILELVRDEVESVRLFKKDFESHERVMATTSFYDSCGPTSNTDWRPMTIAF